jgi:hypothetical protein
MRRAYTGAATDVSPSGLRYCRERKRVLHLAPQNHKRGANMKNPLDSLWGTIILGLILTVILYYIVKALAGG